MNLIDALKLRLRLKCLSSSTTCCAEPTSGASTSTSGPSTSLASRLIRYAQQENLPGLDYARIQENMREYKEGLALGNEQPALLQAIEIKIRNSDPLIQKLIK